MCEIDIKDMMKIETDDNLNLNDIPLEGVPGDILFPEELNQYLRGRIQYLTQMNAKLEQQLLLKDEEIQKYDVKTLNLSNKISEYETITQDLKGVAPTPTASKLMSQKIVELSKKLREKNCEFEVFKTQYNKLLQKVTDLENKNKKKIYEVQQSDSDVKSVDTHTEQIKSLQEKLSIANSKLFDTKNQNTQLKNDLKMANKILLQELGDNFISIQNFTTNGNSNGWRGRAQQILSLQQKNSELQERISNMSDKEIITIPKPDNRKQIIEQLNKDLSNVKKELEETTKKLNSSRARIKVLETECQSMKTKNATQNEKLISNEQLIKMLTNQVANLEDQQNYITKESQVNCEFIMKNYQTELAKERCKLENLHKILQQKEEKIAEYKNELSRVVDSAGYTTPRILSPILEKENHEKLSGKIKVLEVEVNRLLELVAVLNSRLDNERKEHCETQGLYRRERQRAAKLETRLLRMEMEMNTFKTQYYSKSGSKTNSLSTLSDNLSMESVKNNLELAEENIKSLETKMVILQREKEMDYQRFCGILNDTRNIMKKYDMVS